MNFGDPYGNPDGASPASTIEMMGTAGNSFPGETPGADYSGAIPPPPGPGDAAVGQPGYSVRSWVPANMLGLSNMGPRMQAACGFAILFLGAAAGAYLTAPKSRRSITRCLLPGVIGGLAAQAAKPVLNRFGRFGAFGCLAVAGAGGWAAKKWIVK